MTHSPITRQTNSVTLTVRVLPGAKRNGVLGLWNGEALKIALRAPAVDGKANAALIDFLSELCSVKKSAVVFLSGETARIKHIRLTFPTPAEAERAEKALLTLSD